MQSMVVRALNPVPIWPKKQTVRRRFQPPPASCAGGTPLVSEKGGWLERCRQPEPREIGDNLNEKKTGSVRLKV